ncbi:MAG: CapA family protein [Acidobacteria bacterium]|nr:CapA family protein [Acidobacteriota bacterium]
MTPRRTELPEISERSVTWVLFAALVVLALPLFLMSTPDSSDVNGSANGGAEPADGADSTDQADTGTGAADQEVDGPEGGVLFTMAFVGDVLVHESVADQAAMNANGEGYNFDPMFDEVRSTLTDADLSICHLETPLSADNSDLSYYPAFRVPNQIAGSLAKAGFDGCSFASNHTLDAGAAGVESTLDAMADAGLAVSGSARSAEESSSTTYQVGDYSVGHLSYTYGLNAAESLPAGKDYLVDITDAQTISGEAAALRASGADFIVLSIQWGIEYQSEPTAEQVNDAVRLLSSPDVDLIIGHHAHVISPIEPIGSEYVAYGLGNFLSNQSAESCECPAATQDGVILTFSVSKDDENSLFVSDIDATPTRVDRGDFTIVETDSDQAIERFGEEPAAVSTKRTLGVLNQNGSLDN